MIFTAIITLDTDTLEHAQQVIDERIGYDEDYGGFDYQFLTGTIVAPQPPKWAVFDVITGNQVSDDFETDDVASAICRGLNTPGSGGRYHVRTNASGKWERRTRT